MSEVDAPAAAQEPTGPPVPTAEQIDTYTPKEVVEVLHAAVHTSPDINASVVTMCCKRLRVLCREPENCKRCDRAGTATAVVGAMGALPAVDTVQLQALAAIVNLCSGEANEHRKNAVDSGAMKAIVAAMNSLKENAEVQEMACIALQNCCYGEDPNAIVRRQKAANEGALEAVVAAMKQFEASGAPRTAASLHARAVHKWSRRWWWRSPRARSPSLYLARSLVHPPR